MYTIISMSYSVVRYKNKIQNKCPSQNAGDVISWTSDKEDTVEFFHNSRLIRRIQQKEIYEKFRGLSRDWTQIACLAVRYLNHYTNLFSVFVWDCNSILFMHGWFCPIHLIGLSQKRPLWSKAWCWSEKNVLKILHFTLKHSMLLGG